MRQVNKHISFLTHFCGFKKMTKSQKLQDNGETPDPTFLPSNTPGEFTDYNQLPWYRKSGVNSGLILASILTCGLFPGIFIVCIVLSTGEVYFNKKNEQGYLKKWHWGNKIIAILLLLLNIANLITGFIKLFRTDTWQCCQIGAVFCFLFGPHKNEGKAQVQRQIARWLIEHNPNTTHRCYAKIQIGTGCPCIQCCNFNACDVQTFPSEFVAILEELGIDPAKPAELCHWYREPSGLFFTGGWFHLVGSIISGEDAMPIEGNVGNFCFEQFQTGLEFGFTTNLCLVPEVFAEMPLLQLEFQTRVSWVLAEPPPET